ncbi:hypothetical protein E2C01_038855 [Portunus trituberculatus]|uniref:Uncharacterized protein n=1 Tax=Portunus trituberculatus TaxID=210409 RepID=A0A5B7FI08_PORTR|nr:hypothetical protein [Portunus trituberculatus]
MREGREVAEARNGGRKGGRRLNDKQSTTTITTTTTTTTISSSPFSSISPASPFRIWPLSARPRGATHASINTSEDQPHASHALLSTPLARRH